MSVPLVGRKAEFDRLAALVEVARRESRPAAALVHGAPGSGKSRLLAELVERSSFRRRVQAVAFEPIASVPFGAVAELLRWLVTVPGPGRRLDDLVFGGEEAGSRDPLRIFEAAERALAVAGPALIAIDDLQWADDLSLGLIQYLLRGAVGGGNGIVIVGAARPSGAATTFRAGLDGALPADRRVTIALDPLTMDDGVALAGAIDPTIGRDRAAEVWRRAAGSPFWIEALVRGGGSTDPAHLIAERLAALGSDSAALLGALAVMARPFARDELAATLRFDPDRIDGAARELITRGLAVESGGGLRTSHDLIREAAEPGIPASTRRRLHTRVAEIIEAEAGDDIQLLREALEHRLAAGQPATDLALRLVRSPRRRLLGSDGLAVLAGIADRLEGGSTEQLALDTALGGLAAALGEQGPAMRHWIRVAEHATEAHRRERAYVEAAWAAYRTRRGVEARGLLELAAGGPAARDGRDAGYGRDPSDAEAVDPIDLVDLEAEARRFTLEAEIELWLDHHTPAGARAATRALAAAERLAEISAGALSPSGRAAYLAAIEAAMDAALQQDRAEDVARLGETSLDIARGADEEARVAALNRVAFALRTLGHLKEARERYREAWDLARQLVLPYASVEAGQGLARSLQNAGLLAEARDVAEETARIEARLRDPSRRWGNAAAILHGIQLSMEDPATAIRALHADAAAEPDAHFRIGIHQTIAAWLARSRGERLVGQVAAELDAATAESSLTGCPRCAAELAIVSAELFARIGLIDAARVQLEAWEALPGRTSLNAGLWHSRAHAMLLAAAGAPREAASELVDLAALQETATLAEDLIWTRLDLGRVRAGFDRPAAVEAYAAAAELAHRIGARSQERLAAQGLRGLGVRAWRRGPSAGPEIVLSDREAEVARLVATGSSNREIAEALLIAPKTVERHISNALAKLGLRNRTELAATVKAGEPVRGSPDDRSPAPA